MKIIRLSTGEVEVVTKEMPGQRRHFEGQINRTYFARVSVRCVVVVVKCIVVGSYRMSTHPDWMNGRTTE